MIRRAYDWWADRYCPKSIWRWHVKRLGRRGGLLLMLAVLWVGVAAQVAALPPTTAALAATQED